MSFKDMTGERIGNFKICERCGTSSRGSALYTCKCDNEHTFVKSRAQLLDIVRRPVSKQRCPECMPVHADDITGKVFDTVRVLSFDHIGHRGITFWNCVCQSCNREEVYSKEQLRAKKHICKCQQKRYWLDLTGQIFDQITVVEHAYTNSHGQNKWRCLCSCGKEVVVLSTQLTDGSVNMCTECKLKSKNQESVKEALLLIGTVIDHDYTITSYVGQDEHKNHLLELTCNKCGATKVVSKTVIAQRRHGRCECSSVFKEILLENNMVASKLLNVLVINRLTKTPSRQRFHCGNVCVLVVIYDITQQLN